MKMTYEILWIDDVPSEIEELKTHAEDHLYDFGIDVKISVVQADKNRSIRKDIEEDLKNPSLDLIVVDFHMPRMNGDELVNLIRTSDHVFLPVIFYSTRSLEEVYNSVREKKLDGVYITSRENFNVKFSAVVKSLLYKEHSIKQTRGLLMEEVSELDARLMEVFEKGWKKLPTEKKERLIRHVKKIVKQRTLAAVRFEQNIPEEIEEFETFMIRDLRTAKFDTMSRWRIVKKILESIEHDGEEQEIFHGFAGTRKNGTLPLNAIRNKYAHQTRAELGTNHSEKNCIEMRRKIRRQQANLDSILRKLH